MDVNIDNFRPLEKYLWFDDVNLGHIMTKEYDIPKKCFIFECIDLLCDKGYTYIMDDDIELKDLLDTKSYVGYDCIDISGKCGNVINDACYNIACETLKQIICMNNRHIYMLNLKYSITVDYMLPDNKYIFNTKAFDDYFESKFGKRILIINDKVYRAKIYFEITVPNNCNIVIPDNCIKELRYSTKINNVYKIMICANVGISLSKLTISKNCVSIKPI